MPIIQKRKGILFVQSEALSAFDGVEHAFLGRYDGVSTPPYATLNMSLNTQTGANKDTPPDLAENVVRNRTIAASAFGFSHKDFAVVKQVHGNRVITVKCTDSHDHSTEADAMITKTAGAAIGILTADCLPILIYDPVNHAAGAAHAGWRGTAKKIAVRTVHAMQKEFGSNPADMVAALGPSIGPCCYSVGHDTASEINEALKDVAPSRMYMERHGAVDIAAANVLQLEHAGLLPKNVSALDACTSCKPSIFFSYRKEAGKTGRQMSFIVLKDKKK